MTEPEKPNSTEMTDKGRAEKGTQIPPDDLFRAVSKAPRRRVLSYLLDTRETTVAELAAVLTGWHATEAGPAGPSDHQQIELVLRHVHLPMLAADGFVRFDPDDGTVVRRPLAEPVRETIKSAVEYERNHTSTASTEDT
jgi:hypothetical protein